MKEINFKSGDAVRLIIDGYGWVDVVCENWDKIRDVIKSDINGKILKTPGDAHYRLVFRQIEVEGE